MEHWVSKFYVSRTSWKITGTWRTHPSHFLLVVRIMNRKIKRQKTTNGCKWTYFYFTLNITIFIVAGAFVSLYIFVELLVFICWNAVISHLQHLVSSVLYFVSKKVNEIEALFYGLIWLHHVVNWLLAQIPGVLFRTSSCILKKFVQYSTLKSHGYMYSIGPKAKHNLIALTFLSSYVCVLKLIIMPTWQLIIEIRINF